MRAPLRSETPLDGKHQSRIRFFKPLPLSCSANCQTVYGLAKVGGRCGDGWGVGRKQFSTLTSAVEDVGSHVLKWLPFFTDTAQIV